MDESILERNGMLGPEQTTTFGKKPATGVLVRPEECGKNRRLPGPLRPASELRSFHLSSQWRLATPPTVALSDPT